jgi:hypothetical protein
LGLDFTGAIFLGDREKLGAEIDIKHLMRSWNTLMVAQSEKYDIYTMLGKSKVDTKVDLAIDHNEKLELKNIYSENLQDHIHLNPEGIRAIVMSYDFTGLKGLGLMYNVESFNKLNNEALIWVTFINLDTKEVIFTERMKAQPGGFGLRNYWAGAIYVMMKQVGRREFYEWKKKYNK